MNHIIRLHAFELLHGNRIAVVQLSKKYGVKKALNIALRLKLIVLLNNPFKQLNQQRKPSAAEKASQHQIAPAFILYDLLRASGIPEEQAISDLQELIIVVATEFLKFNVPIIQQVDYLERNDQQRMHYFKKITDRFFNAQGKLSKSDNNQMIFTVNKCLFAQYSNQLGYSQLAKVFCSADKHFFDQHQPNIKFNRSITLAEHNMPCDFSFTINAQEGS